MDANLHEKSKIAKDLPEKHERLRYMSRDKPGSIIVKMERLIFSFFNLLEKNKILYSESLNTVSNY